jgi:hypothetical protein
LQENPIHPSSLKEFTLGNESKFLIFALLLSSTALLGQYQRFAAPLSARTSSYDMQIVLDTDKHRIQAQQTVTFTNPSDDTIWTMPFHMYYNAFKNNKTTFYTGTTRIPRSKPQEEIDNCVWGMIEVLDITDEKGKDLTERMAYVQYDDGNKNDHTVLEVRLKTPVLPRGTCQLQMKWQSQIPKLFIRTGYNKDFYFMAQWYPKLGVYEPTGSRFAKKGQWNCHQYHPSTEYFGEFGVYKVAIDVPSNFVVGSSGFLEKKNQKGNRTVHTYLAEDVIDFTWAANPDFVEIKENWRGVEIRLLIRPEHQHNKERFLGAARNTLNFFNEYIEKYPYPTLTIVSPPFYGLAAGAMEYPTLITSPTMSGFPKGILTTETLTIHELTHQYFMQMLSTNEQEEPWMDEGFTSYFEAKIMDLFYEEGVIDLDYFNIHIRSSDLRRGRFLGGDNIKVNPISDFGYHFKHGSYSEIVYGKTAVWLRTLENLVGDDVMKDIMKTYFSRWKFKHPGRQDFIDVVNEVVPKHHGAKFGEDMNWFLHPAIFGTDVCDYAVHSIENNLIPEPLGFFDSTKDCIKPSASKDAKKAIYQSKVIVFRLGEFYVPQEVAITFDDGTTVVEQWDGKGRSYEWVYNGAKKIVSAEIDPNLKISLDKNWINNSYTVKPNTTGFTRYFAGMVSWLQSMMVTASVLV